MTRSAALHYKADEMAPPVDDFRMLCGLMQDLFIQQME